MGLSHASIAGLLDPTVKIILVESDFWTRVALKLTVGRSIKLVAKCSAKDIKTATHAVVATPPHIHESNVLELQQKGFTGRLLIEKPVTVKRAALMRIPDVMSGYVLRRSFFWKKLKSDLGAEVLTGALIKLETNQDFEGKGLSWRTQGQVPGLNLLHEFGSHCINLLIDLVSLDNLVVQQASENHIILSMLGSESFRIELKANSNRVRKSVYTVSVQTENLLIDTDFYTYGKSLINRQERLFTSLADEGVHESAYLRGQEFSSQMRLLLSSYTIGGEEFSDAILTDELIRQIKEVWPCQS